ncbi:uncharacterized protein ATNIH1004_010695 [Aspergillus tanneri]|uniref:C2H2-type domain-containing protein n=1 Tax=Aspergillus tanneri TaxID=1220188 RepID=A0A5M9M833_9EURO|nr:uncharacterized protein ATNIH1004_010695 [Aspergillus tanneri]KAA8641756.1 hypothetical protein ATNIH1004_010695 [Aspergillus tanneri]
MDFANVITSGADPFHRVKQPLSAPVKHIPKLPSISSLLAGADRASAHSAKRERTTSPVVSSVSSHGPVKNVFSVPYVSSVLNATSHSSPTEPPTSSAVYCPRTRSPNTVYQNVGSVLVQAASLPPFSTPHLITPINCAWQHHEYDPYSSDKSFQQNSYRYTCSICYKVFSRPSSIRVHFHSHTGEKPFRCTHAGCGKSFSVKSNMKRHERSCHAARPVATAMV